MPDNIANSTAADVVRSSPLPTSFFGDTTLYGLNLGAMTAATCIGVMLFGWMVSALWVHRRHDKWLHPVTLYRLGWACAALALVLRSGAEAMNLWSWDSNAAAAAARVMLIKRYVDPAALLFGAGGWSLILVLSYDAMVSQLRKAPFPVRMLAQLPSLKRPAFVVALSFAAALGVAWSK